MSKADKFELVVSEASGATKAYLGLLWQRLCHQLSTRSSRWSVLPVQRPEAKFFWSTRALRKHGAQEPSPSMETGRWAIHIGHGFPDVFHAGKGEGYVPLSVLQPGWDGNRYLWLISCNVMAHGAKNRFDSPETFRPWNPKDCLTWKHEDVFDRWGRNYGYVRDPATPLGGGVRLVAGGSTALVVHRHALDATLDALLDGGWGIADAFIHGLTGPIQTPLVLTQGDLPRDASWLDLPLYDREMVADAAPAGSHLFMQYPRNRRRIKTDPKSAATDFRTFLNDSEAGPIDTGEPDMTVNPKELPALTVRWKADPKTLAEDKDLPSLESLRSESETWASSIADHGPLLSFFSRPGPGRAAEWRNMLVGLSGELAKYAVGTLPDLGVGVTLAGFDVRSFEMAIGWRRKPTSPYGNPPEEITHCRKARHVTLAPRFSVKVEGQDLELPLRDALGLLTVRFADGQDDKAAKLGLPVEADVALRLVAFSVPKAESARSVDLAGRDEAIDQARRLFDEQNLDPDGSFSREADSVALAYRLELDPRPPRQRIDGPLGRLLPVYLVYFNPKDGAEGEPLEIEVDARKQERCKR